ncbi:MAG: biotin--[acetyl-CoA-carboxylase] ligase, partial [Polyangiaceae bacterium]
SVCDALAPVVDVEPRIKWPNDVWLETKKVAGILVEASIVGAKVDSLVVGVGINVHTRAFPAEIEAIATSVALHSSMQPDRASIVARLVQALDRDVAPVARHGLGLVHARIQERDALRGSRVRGETGEGTAEGIDVEGRLCVRVVDGTLQRWVAGEVNLLK